MAKLKKENKEKWMLSASIIILGMSVVFFVVSLNLDSLLTLQKQEVPVVVVIGNYTGFNLTKGETTLNLGTVANGSFASRSIEVASDYDFPTTMQIQVIGDISHLLVFSDIIYFDPYEEKEIPIRTKIITNEEQGRYTGTLIVKFKRALV